MFPDKQLLLYWLTINCPFKHLDIFLQHTYLLSACGYKLPIYIFISTGLIFSLMSDVYQRWMFKWMYSLCTLCINTHSQDHKDTVNWCIHSLYPCHTSIVVCIWPWVSLELRGNSCFTSHSHITTIERIQKHDLWPWVVLFCLVRIGWWGHQHSPLCG